jgi:hypothetical protein
MKIQLDPVALAVLLDTLENIARQLETGVDPLQVAQQVRAFIGKTETDNDLTPGTVQCPHCKWGFFPSVIEQHIREKH